MKATRSPSGSFAAAIIVTFVAAFGVAFAVSGVVVSPVMLGGRFGGGFSVIVTVSVLTMAAPPADTANSKLSCAWSR